MAFFDTDYSKHRSQDFSLTLTYLTVRIVNQLAIFQFQDFYAPDKGQPTQDAQQDYDLVAASEREGRTTIRFRRRWDTCDEKNDMIIGVRSEFWNNIENILCLLKWNLTWRRSKAHKVYGAYQS